MLFSERRHWDLEATPYVGWPLSPLTVLYHPAFCSQVLVLGSILEKTFIKTVSYTEEIS